VEIYLIRHTAPQVEPGICYGQTDIPVNDNFISESEKIIKSLPLKIDAVYSSPLMRCTKLAEKIIFSIEPKPQIIIDSRIKELNFGGWEMKKWNDIDKAQINKWADNILKQKTPDGESFSDLNKRVNKFIDDFLKENHENSVIVTHAGVIRCFLLRFKKIPLKETLKIPIDYSSINILKI